MRNPPALKLSFSMGKISPYNTTRQETLSWSPASVRRGGESGVGWETSFPFSPLNPEDGTQSSTWSLAGGGQALTRVFPAVRQPLSIPLTGGNSLLLTSFLSVSVCKFRAEGQEGPQGLPAYLSQVLRPLDRPPPSSHMSVLVCLTGVRPGLLSCGRDGATPCGCNRRSPLLKV